MDEAISDEGLLEKVAELLDRQRAALDRTVALTEQHASAASRDENAIRRPQSTVPVAPRLRTETRVKTRHHHRELLQMRSGHRTDDSVPGSMRCVWGTSEAPKKTGRTPRDSSEERRGLVRSARDPSEEQRGFIRSSSAKRHTYRDVLRDRQSGERGEGHRTVRVRSCSQQAREARSSDVLESRAALQPPPPLPPPKGGKVARRSYSSDRALNLWCPRCHRSLDRRRCACKYFISGRVYIEDGELIQMEAIPIPPGCFPIPSEQRAFIERLQCLAERVTALPPHRNIVQCFDVEYVNKKLSRHMVVKMEYLPSTPLSHHIKANTQLGDREAADIVRQLLSGLSHVHAHNLAHGSLQGASILHGDGGLVKMRPPAIWEAVFGNGRSGPWLAPELLEAGAEATPKSDIWAIGCIVLELLTGATPWAHLGVASLGVRRLLTERRPVLRLPFGLSTEAADFVTTCFQLNPKDRPTAADLLAHPYLSTTTSGLKRTASVPRQLSPTALGLGDPPTRTRRHRHSRPKKKAGVPLVPQSVKESAGEQDDDNDDDDKVEEDRVEDAAPAASRGASPASFGSTSSFRRSASSPLQATQATSTRSLGKDIHPQSLTQATSTRSLKEQQVVTQGSQTALEDQSAQHHKRLTSAEAILMSLISHRREQHTHHDWHGVDPTPHYGPESDVDWFTPKPIIVSRAS